jgi:hypothetical protein
MENQEQNQTPTQPELSITDLKNIRAILDVAVRRGTFGANEISGVGAVFDRLNNFLNAVAPADTAEANTEQPTT